MSSRTKLANFTITAILAGLLAGCGPNLPTSAPTATPTPTIAPTPRARRPLPPTPSPTPSPTATATPKPSSPLFEPPDAPELSTDGEGLVIEFEVGGRSGYKTHPEAPDCRSSGWTTGIGYDWSQVPPQTAVGDWQASIGERNAGRLAAGHKYVGCVAKDHLHEVADILTPWEAAIGVFDKIDVAREWSRAERAMPGFAELRPNAQAALISLGFNRGWSMTGDSRREMRAIRDAVPKGDYAAIAAQLRAMVRVWKGTDIYRGMYRRRNAEADLVLKP